MKILKITGSYPPDHCGIGDYTFLLCQELISHKQEVVILTNQKWNLLNLLSILKKIKDANPDVIHIQYPSLQFGLSLVPQIISILYRTTVTIHEVSQAHFLRKLSLLPFSIRSRIIFTNIYELKYFKKIFPWFSNRSCVIPIGSNIIPSKNTTIDREYNNIVYFGQIRPEKGLEEVINLAKILKEEESRFRVIIAGQLIEKFQSYYNSLAIETKMLPINWQLNCSAEQINNLLSSSYFAYLPFPDGASERRGSLLAALANNMLVFTTKGPYTPADIEGSVLFCESAMDVYNELLKNDLLLQRVSKIYAATEYIKKFDWSNIAMLHLAFYSRL